MITALDKNTALVLIDLQKGIAKGHTAPHPVQEVLTNSARLADAFHKAKLPVIVVTLDLRHAAWLKARRDSRRIPKNKILLALARLMMSLSGHASVVKEINTQPGDIFITKTTPNAFYNTTLHAELQKRRITNIVLCGISTSNGVEGTARAAVERGYNVSFATDAMSDRSAQSHQSSITYILPRLGELGSSSDIIQHLQNRA